MRTHYDNLQIPRDADEQTIRQAYRRLSKQYHPDLNPSEDASRIMQLINRAYTVLSDPEQRAEHDRWIRQQETLRIPQQPTLRRQSAPQPQRQPENECNEFRRSQNAHSASNTAAPASKTSKQKPWQSLFIIACCALVALFFWQLNSYLKTQAAEEETHATQPETAGTAPADATQPENEAPAGATPSNYVRPSTAPNGEPFPSTSGYVKNYPYTRSTTKQLTIFVDNIRNTSDVFAELHQANAPQPLRNRYQRNHRPIRQPKRSHRLFAARQRIGSLKTAYALPHNTKAA